MDDVHEVAFWPLQHAGTQLRQVPGATQSAADAMSPPPPNEADVADMRRLESLSTNAEVRSFLHREGDALQRAANEADVADLQRLHSLSADGQVRAFLQKEIASLQSADPDPAVLRQLLSSGDDDEPREPQQRRPLHEAVGTKPPPPAPAKEARTSRRDTRAPAAPIAAARATGRGCAVACAVPSRHSSCASAQRARQPCISSAPPVAIIVGCSAPPRASAAAAHASAPAPRAAAAECSASSTCAACASGAPAERRSSAW